MTDRTDRLLELAVALSDGTPVDWDALEAASVSESERRQIQSMRLVGRLADGRTDTSETDVVTHPPVWGFLRLIEPIGRGRFGDVYRAFDPRLDREVALKLLRHPDSQGDVIGSAVIEEGRLLAKVRHPNVVTVYGAERIDGRVGVWMELVAGRTLEDELLADGPQTAEAAIAASLDICHALSAVHRAGLLHRDIKTQNVMRAADGRIVLMDFGTGREVVADVAPELAGTPLYLAPEVLDGGPATVQSDVYSVGVLLYRILTSGFPVRGQTVRELRAEHRRQHGPDVERLGHFPPALVDVLRRALACDPSQRFATAEAMTAALNRVGLMMAAEHTRPVSSIAVVTGRRAGVTVGVLLLAALGLWVWRSDRYSSLTPPPSGVGSRQAARQWAGDGVNGSGTPSPDGRYLTFTDFETGDLAIRDLTSGSSRRLTDTGGWIRSGDFAERSVISRDGGQVAYSWFVERDLALELRVKQLGAETVPESRLLDRVIRPGQVTPLAWTPGDSHVVVMRSETAREIGLGVVSVADGSYRSVKSPLQEPLNGASLSPDGRYLAYAVPAGPGETQHDIFVVAMDGSSESLAVQSPSDDLYPLWSRESANLLFLSDRTGTPSLWSVPMLDGRPSAPPILLKADMGAVRPLGISEAGAIFYYLSGRARQNIYTTPLDGMQATAAPALVAERFVNANGGPSWSRDGQYLAYYSFRPQPTLVIRSVRTGEERDVLLKPGVLTPFYAGPKWFPDNRSVLVLRRAPGSDGAGFYRRHWESEQETLLFQFEAIPSSYDLSPDGRTVFYTLQGNAVWPGNGQLVAVEIASGRETILRKNEWLIAVAVSPDGREVAYLKSVRGPDRTTWPSVVEVMPASGGSARQVFRDEPWLGGNRYNTLAWFPDGRHVMFARDRGGLWRVRKEGGMPTAIGVTMNARIKSPAVHPDGTRLAFATIDADNNEVWLLENFLPTADERRPAR